MNSTKFQHSNLKIERIRKIFSRGVYAVAGRDFLDISGKKSVGCIQLRQKNANTLSLIKNIRSFRKRNRKLPLFIDDRIDAAFAIGAKGAHLGNGDMGINLARRILGRNFILGKTVRNEKQAKIAEKESADYISIGPIFKTPVKKGIKPKGLLILKKLKKSVHIPVIAIGGINFSNMNKVRSYGADGVAMMRGIRKIKNQSFDKAQD